MRVDPVHAAVGTFFNNSPMFRVPKYQRSYAWESAEVDDYLKDLEDCFINRKNNTPINHFFGGMVSVESTVTGVVNQKRHELVDGQQRCATFVLTISAIIKLYKDILNEINDSDESTNFDIVTRRIKTLENRFIEFTQEVNRQTQVVESLCLSKADKHFFNETARNLNPTPRRESHNRIKKVYERLLEKVNSLIPSEIEIVERLDLLETLQLVIDSDFSIIHIITYDTKEAYKLFQVLNDRGKSLTEGDLLRAKTLELLEDFHTQQDSTEHQWDEILEDKSKSTENFLRWIFQSHVGSRAGRNTLFDDFLSHFYPEHANSTISNSDADKILFTSKKLNKEVARARKISKGDWPFSTTSRPITGWDRNRLSLLINELGLTVTIPLLLSSYNLGEKKFSKIVQLIERFLFRYKIISNAHIERAVSIFQAHSTVIRNNPTNYQISSLKTDLQEILNERAGELQFKTSLQNLQYKVGGGNRPLKYFLMTLEHYKRWYEKDESGPPVCNDKTRIYDFSSTTLEHIYPRNAPESETDESLEPLKNSLGNITFMGPDDNNIGGNDNFTTKKPLFQNSSVRLNNDIGNFDDWNLRKLNERKEDIIEMACKIFNL